MGKREDLEQSSALTSAAGATKANKNLGVTKKYDRSLYDSKKSKDAYKTKVFAGKKTMIDPETGERLHISHKAAKNKYTRGGAVQSTAWAKHAAETDHVVPLKQVHDKNSKNPFLKDSDIKDVANRSSNYQILSKSKNAAKQDSSDSDKVVMKKASQQMAIDFAGKTASSVGSEFWNGSVDALKDSGIPLAIYILDQLSQVQQKEKSPKEAAINIGKFATKVALTGGGTRIAKTAVQNMKPNILKSMIEKDAPAQIVAVSLVLKDSVFSYYNGEIDSKEFAKQITSKSMGLIAGKGVGILLPEIPLIDMAVAAYITDASRNILDELAGDGAFAATMQECGYIVSSTEKVKSSLDVMESISNRTQEKLDSTHNAKNKIDDTASNNRSMIDII